MHTLTVIKGYVATVATMPADTGEHQQQQQSETLRFSYVLRAMRRVGRAFWSAGAAVLTDSPPMAPLMPSTAASDGMVLYSEISAVLWGG